MSVLRYCCFRWLVYDRALVFEPSRPLACNMILVWLILFVELCCDIFPWVPDLDRTRLHAWLVYDWIGGVTSWYQSRLPIGILLPHSLAKVESSHYKTFTNMAVCLTGPRHHWVVLGSFIPRLYSGILLSLLFRLNDFTNYNSRFSLPLLAGEPLHYKWSTASIEDSDNTLRCSPETLCHCFCNFLPPKYPYG